MQKKVIKDNCRTRFLPPQTNSIQGWGAGAGRSRFFLAHWSRSRLKKKPGAGTALQKKSGAGAAKKLAGSSALREDKKH